MARILLENLFKSFSDGKSHAISQDTKDNLKANILNDINFQVEDGEFLVIVGPSGCGKSTLLRVIAGLEELTKGNIWIGNRLVNHLDPKERDIAMVFQNYALYPHLNVYDNIAFGLRRMSSITKPNSYISSSWTKNLLAGISRLLPKKLRYLTNQEKTIQEQVRKVAQLLQIEHLLTRFPKQLSGGQKQRVALGRAIARNPQVFLMDEPLSNLDAKLRNETRGQIVQLQRQLKTTTIYVTHDQTEAMTMGDRIAVINQGKIQQIASPLEIYNYPANIFVAEFIGSPPMNFLTVEVKNPNLITHPHFRLTLSSDWEKTINSYQGRALLLGIRPEHLTLASPAPKNLSVTIDFIEALGNDTYLAVHLTEEPTTTLKVRIPPDYFFQVGESIWLSIILDKIQLFEPETGKTIREIQEKIAN